MQPGRRPGGGVRRGRWPGGGAEGRWRAVGLPWSQLGRDAPLAGAVLVAHVLLSVLLDPGAGWPAVVGWSALWAALVALRRLATRTAVGLASGLLALAVLSQPEATGHLPGALVLTYTAAGRLPLLPAAAAATLLWLPATVAGALARAPVAPRLAAEILLVVLVAFLAGRAGWAGRAFTDLLSHRAGSAEADRQAATAQAVAQERRRIARELHDVVAHHVSVMGVLATGARRVLRRDVDAADEALATIEGTGRTALREMQRLLDILRTEAEEPGAHLSPQPDLAGIAPLVQQLRDAGLPVQLRVDGTPGRLAPGVALSVYRIVQEALTNILKHAGTATAEVRLSFGLYWLIVEVLDDGRGVDLAPDRGTGHGLVGMRERVALYGGTLHTGPRPGGGYRVHAKIPVEDIAEPG